MKALAKDPVARPASLYAGDRRPNSNKSAEVFSKVIRACLLALVLFAGLSYRLYLARYHTEVGIQGMAGWYDYILANAALLERGQGLSSTLYAPGQSLSVYLLYQIVPREPAALRVVFGAVDGIAVVFLFVLGREVFGWWAGLLASAFYALWPEGASASVNILHDHSPQPLFMFAGLWLTMVWVRRRRWWMLIVAGILLGLPPLFRTDGLVLTGAVAVALAAALWRSGLRRIEIAGQLLLLIAGSLVPSLPYDLYIHAKTGQLVHIAAGDAGAAVFLRYGRTSGSAGTRFADTEVACVGGVNEPFGYDWGDARRMKVLSRFGKELLWADPLNYLRLVSRDTWSHLIIPAGFEYWLAPGFADLGDIFLTQGLRTPEWPLAVLVSASRVQSFLTNRRALLAVALLGILVGFRYRWRQTLVVALPLGLWVVALILTLPNSRYLLMPYCLLFVPLGIAASWAGTLAKSLTRRAFSRVGTSPQGRK